jgi:hypothetical protein
MFEIKNFDILGIRGQRSVFSGCGRQSRPNKNYFFIRANEVRAHSLIPGP